jgi:hypothetical protein
MISPHPPARTRKVGSQTGWPFWASSSVYVRLSPAALVAAPDHGPTLTPLSFAVMYLIIHLVLIVVSHHGFPVNLKLIRGGSLLPCLTFSSLRRNIGRIVRRWQAGPELPIPQLVPSPVPSTGIHGQQPLLHGPISSVPGSVNGSYMPNASQHSLAPSETPTMVPPLLS